jgi:hypothetical protein
VHHASTEIVADKRLTPIGLGRKLVLCFQVIFAPGTMLAAELKDNEARKAFPSPDKPPHVAYIVRRAFWTALGVVIGAIFFGLICGRVLRAFIGTPTPEVVTWLQIIGAGLLLWGTLFVRGWEIQSYGGDVDRACESMDLPLPIFCRHGSSYIIGSMAMMSRYVPGARLKMPVPVVIGPGDAGAAGCLLLFGHPREKVFTLRPLAPVCRPTLGRGGVDQSNRSKLLDCWSLFARAMHSVISFWTTLNNMGIR